MQTTPNEEILNYWNRLREGRPAPLRSELDPAAMRHFLPHLFIVSTTAPHELTFALAGTRICELFGKELRGRDFRSMWEESSAVQTFEIAESVLLYERPALLNVDISPAGREYPYELLLMPLRSADYGSDRILGALTPRGIAVPDLMLPLHFLSLLSWAFVEPNGELPRFDNTVDGSAPEPASLLKRLIAANPFAQAGR